MGPSEIIEEEIFVFQIIEANWLIFILALLIGIVVAYWIFVRATTKPPPRERRPDVLDEGAEPVRRNQALIDSPPSAAIVPPTGAGTMAGIGEVVSVAAQDEVEQAEALDWEAKEQAREEGEKRGSERPETAAPEPSTPTTSSASSPTPVADGEADDLRKLKGVGPKLVTVLTSLGITRYEQIANWTEEDIDRIDAQLGSFAGRIHRDNWVEQATYLSAGDTAGYEAKFGKL